MQSREKQQTFRLEHICRYDVFRRCVMELPPSSHDTSNAPFTLTLHDPSTYTLPLPSLAPTWQPLVMLANLPHLEVLLTVTEGGQPVQCMLMLDSGAGGVDAMFHARAVQELGLAQANKHGIRTLMVCSFISLSLIQQQSHLDQS